MILSEYLHSLNDKYASSFATAIENAIPKQIIQNNGGSNVYNTLREWLSYIKESKYVYFDEEFKDVKSEKIYDSFQCKIEGKLNFKLISSF